MVVGGCRAEKCEREGTKGRVVGGWEGVVAGGLAPVLFISARTRFTKKKLCVLGVTMRAYCCFRPAPPRSNIGVMSFVIAMTQALVAFMTN